MPTAVRRGVARAQPAAAMAKSLIRRSPGLGFGFRWRTKMERVVAKLDGEEREQIAAAKAVIAAARQGAARREQGMAARPRGARGRRRARQRREEDEGHCRSPSPPQSLRGAEPRRARPGPLLLRYAVVGEGWAGAVRGGALLVRLRKARCRGPLLLRDHLCFPGAAPSVATCAGVNSAMAWAARNSSPRRRTEEMERRSSIPPPSSRAPASESEHKGEKGGEPAEHAQRPAATLDRMWRST